MKWDGEENPPIHIKKQTLSSSPHKWKDEKPPRHACSLSKQKHPDSLHTESHHFASLTPWSIRKTQRNAIYIPSENVTDHPYKSNVLISPPYPKIREISGTIAKS
ncbi:hypothetical protein MRB53_018852 [Persea americana]|uniref:Uncharacterized protein n=1 Tax=Persea americana TaxID=3435 RepID=A0ACC2M992_PERAE|nr:hypothetical protein MRB53_018852 [Persea americana]